MKLSCGIIPVRKNGRTWEFLLLRCYKFWDFPKGMIDPGESPLDTALREFTEETGLHDIELLSPALYYETEIYSNGKVARYYLGIYKGNEEVIFLPNPVSGIVEHHGSGWFTRTEAELKVVPRIQKALSWAERHLSRIS